MQGLTLTTSTVDEKRNYIEIVEMQMDRGMYSYMYKYICRYIGHHMAVTPFKLPPLFRKPKTPKIPRDQGSG